MKCKRPMFTSCESKGFIPDFINILASTRYFKQVVLLENETILLSVLLIENFLGKNHVLTALGEQLRTDRAIRYKVCTILYLGLPDSS